MEENKTLVSEIFSEKPKEKKKGNKSRFASFFSKVLALLAAVFIWLYASGTDATVSEVIFTVPIQIENADELEERFGWSVISGANNYVEVRLSGKKAAVSKLTEDMVSAYADVLSVTETGRHQLDVTVVAPGEFTVIEKSVNSISVYIDKKMSVTVPVKVRLTDFLLDSSYRMEEPVPSVSEVTVSGPSSEVERIDAAQVSLSLGTISRSLTASGTLVPVDANGNEVTGNYFSMKIREVTVSVVVYTEKSIPLTVGYQYGFYNAYNVAVSIEPSALTLRGEPSAFSSLNSLQVALLDEKSITGQSTTILVQPKIPEGLVIENDIDSVSITVTQIGTITDSYRVGSDLFVVNNPGGLKYTFPQETLDLTLRGTPYEMSLVNSDSVHVTVDLSALNGNTGETYSVPVSVSFSDELFGKVYELGEYKVRVKLD